MYRNRRVRRDGKSLAASGPRTRPARLRSWLEHYLQRQLHLTRGSGGVDHARVRLSDVRHRIPQIHFVERVEGFPAELHEGVLAEIEVLHQRCIQVVEGRPGDQADARVAKRKWLWNTEHARQPCHGRVADAVSIQVIRIETTVT